MKKRNFALCGLAAVAALSITSCKPQGEKEPANGTVDVHLNYNGVQGVTYRGTAGTSWANAVNNVTYTNGKLLPTWEAFANNLDIRVREACGYNSTKDADNYTAVSGNNFMSDTDSSQPIDLFYNTTANINKMGSSNLAVDLTSYIEAGKMPNFKAYLDKNQSVKEEITSNGKIFFTPYFDSYNDVERNLVMDTSIVKLLLDGTNTQYDTEKKNGVNGDTNVVTDAKYQPFIDADHNYPNAETKVKVSVNGQAKEITIKQTDNIIKKQNELLSRATGATGKELAEQFVAYLTAAFGDNVGTGKTFATLSEIFTEEQAAYNVDELIALMRVVKANPKLITGDASKEVETLFPRGQAANRIQNMLHFAQVWGVQGLVSEKDFLYFLQDGTLNDARTSKASYDALDNLAALYDEGLILGNFWYYSDSAKDGNAYLNKYFKKTKSDFSYGLMEYDYTATQCVANDAVDGIGTKSADRAEGAKNLKVEGIKPILPPLTMWGTAKTVTHNQDLTDFAGKTLMRHYDENRSIKGNSWCIPASADNKEGAVKLMDYLFSDMGLYIQDFGPEAYWSNADAVKANPSKVTPIMSTAQKSMIQATNLDFWTYMRACMGSTHGIGHVRTTAIQIQATNAHGQVGYEALERAFADGVVDLSLVDKDGDNKTGTVTWNTSVPVNNYSGAPAAKSTEANTYDATLTFWAQDKNKSEPVGWVYAVAKGGFSQLADTTKLGKTSNSSVDYTVGDVKTQQDAMNKKYLYAYANSLNTNFGVTTFIPAYAKQTA
jgi:putative aldouronate transport system substrate-binding protein